MAYLTTATISHRPGLASTTSLHSDQLQNMFETDPEALINRTSWISVRACVRRRERTNVLCRREGIEGCRCAAGPK